MRHVFKCKRWSRLSRLAERFSPKKHIFLTVDGVDSNSDIYVYGKNEAFSDLLIYL